jgi:hypothetical protein
MTADRIYSGHPNGGHGMNGGRIVSPMHNGSESHYRSVDAIKLTAPAGFELPFSPVVMLLNKII